MQNPAFLFYDGDAARDVSHMNRTERGCYFDFIQAQRKFHGITAEQARKILGKDYDSCWNALELILSKDKDGYYIKWLRDSIERRNEYTEKQRKRIQEYWDKKKTKIPRNNHGNTTVLPLENEINKKKGCEGGIKFDLSFVEENFKEPFMLWIAYKKSRKEMYKTQQSLEACYRNLKTLSADSPLTASKVVDQSMGNNWQGLFPLRQVKNLADPKMSSKYLK